MTTMCKSKSKDSVLFNRKLAPMSWQCKCKHLIQDHSSPRPAPVIRRWLP